MKVVQLYEFLVNVLARKRVLSFGKGDQSFFGLDLAGLRYWALGRTCLVFLASDELDFFPLDVSPGPPAVSETEAEPNDGGLRPTGEVAETTFLGRSSRV